MFETALRSVRTDQTLKFALIGGLAAVPLVLGDYRLSGTADFFPVTMVFFGGLLAGFLARRGSADPGRAAVGAGIVGGLPGIVWILPAMLRTWRSFAEAWSSPAAAALVLAFAALAALGVSALTGLVGGTVGSWLAGRIASTESSAVGT